MIITFYSFKGGVGRTMALANIAELYYQAGYRVLIVDWDLEAPGLERFFPVDQKKVLEQPGLIDLLLSYKKKLSSSTLPKNVPEWPFEKPLDNNFLIEVYSEESINRKLLLLTAGRRSREYFEQYAEAVLKFDWGDFYSDWEGELFFDWLRQEFEKIADIVLIDSRTGVTEMGGVCTYQMADIILMFSTPNEQSLDGTYSMLQAFRDPQVEQLRGGRPLSILVVPSRIDELYQPGIDQFKEQFFRLFNSNLRGLGEDNIIRLWEARIPYIPKYAYSESVAVREQDKASAETMLKAYSNLFDLLKDVSQSYLQKSSKIFADLRIDSHKPRLLIVDPNPEFRSHLENLISLWGYESIVAQGTGKELLEDAVRKANSYRCHIALVELRLLGEEDKGDASGLELIDLIRPTVSIILTAYVSLENVKKALIENKAINVISKSEDPSNLHDILNKAISDTSAYGGKTKILYIDDLSSIKIINTIFPGRENVPASEVDDILVRLFPNTSVLRISYGSRFPGESLSLESDTYVLLRIIPDGQSTCIVKLARSQIISAEIDNYQKYIKGQFTGQFSLPFPSYAILWDIGGLVYSIDWFSKELIKFSDFYINSAPKQINNCLNNLFKYSLTSLYKSHRHEQEKPLLTVYEDIWGFRWYEKIRLAEKIQGSNYCIKLREQLEIPNPIAWFEKIYNAVNDSTPKLFSTTTMISITHGDLHGDNLLIDRNQNAWVIDFSRTGPGPALQDFTELEVDILIRLTKLEHNDLTRFIQLCSQLIMPKNIQSSYRGGSEETTLKKPLSVTHTIRRLAKEQTGISDARQYYWGLLFNTIYAIILWDQQGYEIDRALLLGGLICHRLDHWEDSWPPVDWPIIPIKLSKKNE